MGYEAPRANAEQRTESEPFKELTVAAPWPIFNGVIWDGAGLDTEKGRARRRGRSCAVAAGAMSCTDILGVEMERHRN